MDPRNIFSTAKAIHVDAQEQLGPPEEGVRSTQQHVVPKGLVRNTRGYIERIANQANGAYENGWYDACAVMIRRLLETLIIEAYEHHKISAKIKSASGDFLYLRDLIDRCLQEPAWNLTRGCKQAMPKLKDIGDKSAHSRRFVARRTDIDPLQPQIRLVVEELLFISKLK